MVWVSTVMVACLLGLLGFQGYSTYITIQENQKVFDQAVSNALKKTAERLEKNLVGERTFEYIMEVDTLEDGESASVVTMSFNNSGDETVVVQHNSEVVVVNGDTTLRDDAIVTVDVRAKSNPKAYAYTTTGDEDVWVMDPAAKKEVIKKRLKKIEHQQEVFSGIWEELLLDPYDVNDLAFEQVHEVLDEELRENGLDLDFQFWVWMDEDSLFLGNPEAFDPRGPYQARLIPSFVFEESPMLAVEFPGKMNYVMLQSSVSLVTTVFLLLVMGLSFGYVLKRFYGQRKLSRLKDELISNMSHELKTPLANISLATESLSEPKLGDKKLTYLNIIQEENKRMMDQVNKALMLSQGEVEEQLETIQLKTFVQKMVSKFNLQLNAQKGKIDLEIPVALEISAGKDTLDVILSNLLDNAIKYGGEPPQVHIAGQEKDGFIELIISDNGGGVPTEFQELIFDRFFRVPSGNVQNTQGTGLGLSIVKEKLESMGGSITYGKKNEEGSRFTIRIPKRK